ncbi:hypothetical protein [Rhodococcus gannanensis]|uniref:Uncharacterized protein n=1 Tax=Rhodococcus gannanensis TaxID=1960308 RepID=A0ABW4P629_9NOCA
MTLPVRLARFLTVGAVAVPMLALAPLTGSSTPLPNVAVPAAAVDVVLDDDSDDARDRDRDRDAEQLRNEQRQQQLERRQDRCEEAEVPLPPMCVIPPPGGSVE